MSADVQDFLKLLHDKKQENIYCWSGSRWHDDTDDMIICFEPVINMDTGVYYIQGAGGGGSVPLAV